MSDSPEDVTLTEHEDSDPLQLSVAEETAIENLRVGNTDAEPLSVTHERDDDGEFETRIHSTSAIGTVRLPSGRRVTVTPKETVGRLLWLLAYAHDTPAATLSAAADLETGAQFHRVLALLFETELRAVLRRGLDQSYTDRETVQRRVRGRLDVQRQLRRPTGPAATDFAVEYRTPTNATTLNHAVAVAGRRLQRLLTAGDGVERAAGDGVERAAGRPVTSETQSDQIAARLAHTTRAFRDRLDGPVPQTVSQRAVDQIELSRLTDHYAALLALTRTVLSGAFFEDLQPGDRRARALFVDANSLFERVLERATRAVVADRPYTVVGQAAVPALVHGPHGSDTVRPDIVVAHADGADANGGDTAGDDGTGDDSDDQTLPDRAVAVLDAKWKPGGATGDDAIQMAGYCLTLDAPGALVFPDTAALADRPSTVAGEHALYSVGLPTDAESDTPAAYTDGIEEAVAAFLDKVIGQ